MVHSFAQRIIGAHDEPELIRVDYGATYTPSP
jgi:hypothetical protein